MKCKNLILSVLVLAFIFTAADVSYAQFWENWFQKDKQDQQLDPEQEPVKETDGMSNKQDLKAQDMPEPEMSSGSADVEIWTIDEPKDTAEQATSEAESTREQSPVPASSITTELDKEEREQALKNTQEQVDQIKKIQELNNIQSSLDSIRRINEINRQQRRIDEINRLNRIQKNLDELRRLEQTKN
jgi:hypothetical protein